MVKFYSHLSTFNHGWEDVTSALWRKYPNPLSKHVLSCDVVERFVDPKSRILHSVRLIIKKGPLPKIGAMFVGSNTGMVIEHATVDPKRRIMKTVTRNLTYTSVMSLEETVVYSQSPENESWTECKSSAMITSGVRGWRGTIEDWGVSKFKSTQDRGRQALLSVIECMREERRTLMAGARAAKDAVTTAQKVLSN